MIFYNIHGSKEFFSKLSRCDGRIDIVSDDGNITEFMGSNASRRNTEWNYFDGTINKIELKFHDPEDLVEMLMYVHDKRSYGKYSLRVSELG